MEGKDELTPIEIIDLINNLKNEELYTCIERIGKLQEEHIAIYRDLYNLCDDMSERSQYANLSKDETRIKKGKCLEELVMLLLTGTGDYYRLYGNMRTTSNEVDCFVKLNEKGKAISRYIDPKFHNIICECKNHKKVNVGHVGKFYSLLSYLPVNFGMFFSWKEISGKESGINSYGLIKKIFLSTMHKEKPTYIIDWNKREFKRVLDGESFFTILNEKVEALEMDCDLSKYLIAPHENRDKMRKLIEEINSTKV